MAVNDEVFQSFSMFHLAGLKDFSFMKKCSNVVDLRQRLLVTGVGAGPGQVRDTKTFKKVYSPFFLSVCGPMSLRLEPCVPPSE